jgi:hypothetical protein
MRNCDYDKRKEKKGILTLMLDEAIFQNFVSGVKWKTQIR